jgi:hypothetical protein
MRRVYCCCSKRAGQAPLARLRHRCQACTRTTTALLRLAPRSLRQPSLVSTFLNMKITYAPAQRSTCRASTSVEELVDDLDVSLAVLPHGRVAAALGLELDPLDARDVLEERRERPVCRSVVPAVDNQGRDGDLVHLVDDRPSLKLIRDSGAGSDCD